MIQVENVILSEALFEEHFACDLSACKGACCIEGDAGAPVEIEEISQIESNLEGIIPFLTEKGKKSIEKQGVFTVDTDGEYVTTLNNGKECSFTTFDKNGTAKCGIEDAYRANKSDFRKPSSCHLYPIRISKLKHYDALNYDRWDICKPACECGSKLKIKVFQFLKEPLTNKYGADWYQQLIEVNKLLEKEKI
ncbi:MAG: DUF3109 family protein [Flavobacteriales bacterium]|nr:DUF3109 family protein [Flavobacteriales bacterium]